MNDVTVADWTCLVAARVELSRAELRVDDAMQRVPTNGHTEKTCIAGPLEAAFVRMRAARRALTLLQLAISGPRRGET